MRRAKDLLLGATPGGKRQSGQGGKRRHACPFQDRRAVVLDGALADAEVGSNGLTRMAGQDRLHDLALPRREAANSPLRVFMPGSALGGIP